MIMLLAKAGTYWRKCSPIVRSDDVWERAVDAESEPEEDAEERELEEDEESEKADNESVTDDIDEPVEELTEYKLDI